MKILVIRNAPIIGGAELYHIKLADAFKKYHLNCKLVLLTNNNLFAKNARAHNIESHIVDAFSEEVGTKRGLIRLLLNLPDYLSKYLRIIEKIQSRSKIDCVVFSGKTEKYILTPFAKLFDLPVIWLEHGQVFTSTMAKEALMIYQFMSHFVNKILAESHDAETNLIENHIDPNKILYLGSGIDTDYFSVTRTYRKKYLTIGFLASVTWEKGIKDYLEVAKRICKRNKIIKFLVIGEGPQLPFSKEFVKINKLEERIKFADYQEKPKKYLAFLDLLLSPIHYHGGISLSVEEAMSMGIIPIVTNMGGNNELVINNNNGYIFSNDYSAKASKMILRLSANRSLLRKLSITARKHIVDKFSVRILVNKWYSILKLYVY